MEGALVAPYGILSAMKNPRGPTEKAVFSLSSSSISTCQKPDLRSNLVKYLLLAKQSSISSTLGRVYASLMVLLFNSLRSMQNLRLLSFFLTKTTLEQYGDLDLLMAPQSNISFKCCLTSSYIEGGILL